MHLWEDTFSGDKSSDATMYPTAFEAKITVRAPEASPLLLAFSYYASQC